MGRRIRELTGLRVGKLLVTGISPDTKRGARTNILWRCKCDCGAFKDILGGNLTRKKAHGQVSCGCHLAAKFKAANDARKKTEAARKLTRKLSRDAYRVANLPYFAAYRAKRRDKETAQACECCTKEEFIRFYALRPKGCHADHIYPISRGGMHCLKNLQYLSAFDNQSKGARIPSPEYVR